MKIAIIIPGPIRSFANNYESLLKYIILPIEEKYGKGSVKIFMDYFTVTKEFYEKEYDKNMFNTKMEIDAEGYQEILDNSEYIAYKNSYVFKDDYVENIFNEINKENNSNYDCYELKNYNKELYKNQDAKGFKFKNYYVFMQGIIMNYNNKQLLEKVPDDYDIIIKYRADAKLLKFFPFSFLDKIEDNTIYLPIASGGRWDTFFVATANSMRNLYKNYYSECITLIDTYKKNDKFEAEDMLIKLIKLTGNKLEKLNYFQNDHWNCKRNLINNKYKCS